MALHRIRAHVPHTTPASPGPAQAQPRAPSCPSVHTAVAHDGVPRHLGPRLAARKPVCTRWPPPCLVRRPMRRCRVAGAPRRGIAARQLIRLPIAMHLAPKCRRRPRPRRSALVGTALAGSMGLLSAGEKINHPRRSRNFGLLCEAATTTWRRSHHEDLLSLKCVKFVYHDLYPQLVFGIYTAVPPRSGEYAIRLLHSGGGQTRTTVVPLRSSLRSSHLRSPVRKEVEL